MEKRLFIILILSFSTWIMFAQIPRPEEVCSHALTHSFEKRTAAIDYQLQDSYDVIFYFLNLNAESNSSFLSGEILIKARALENLDTLVLELSNVMEVQSILWSGQELTFNHQSDVLQVIFQQNIEANEIFEVIIKYQGTAIADGGRGYNNANSYHGTNVSWTLSEPFYSKDWWPCKQDLTDKADSVWVFVTTSKENKVGSNGWLTQIVELENAKLRYEWKSRYPIAFYLISIAVAEYMEYSFDIENEKGESIFVQNYLYPDSVMFKNQKALIDCTRMQMNLLQERYGTYPFIDEKYGHCITPIGGGMEHQTMTTQNSFAFHLTIHEMGHSWFGNQVTCAQWNDIWINEGFATYSQYLGLQYLSDEASADGFMAGMQSIVMREPDGSVYVPDDDLNDRARIFSGRLSYYKGAVIIHMIRYVLNNDELFFSILKEFQFRFKNQTATGEDFKGVLEELSGQDFQEFFDLWYYGEGYPIYNFQWQQNVNNQLLLKSTQQSSTDKTAFFPMKYDVLLFYEDGSNNRVQLEQKTVDEEFVIPLSKRIRNILPNPRSQNLMDIQSVKQGILQPNQIKIEPNPARQKCILRFGNYYAGRIIQVYDSGQQLIFSEEADQFTKVLDLSSWSSGIYFIQIVEEDRTEIRKLVKI